MTADDDARESVSAAVAPERLVISCRRRSDDAPVAGAVVSVRLPMYHKNAHSIWIGPTDEHGVVVVTGGEIEEKARRDSNLFVMDYIGYPGGYAGPCELRVVDRDAARRALDAYEMFSSVFDYRPGHRAMVDQWLNADASAAVADLALYVIERAPPTVAVVIHGAAS